MDAAFTADQDELRSQARAFLAETPEPPWSELAALGWTGVSVAAEHGGAGLGFVEEGIVLEELARVLAPGPYLATVAGLLPALPVEEQQRVAEGEASWVLSLGPLVPNLDTVTNVAIVGGDGIYELVGFERELLTTLDETRPLGVVTGGDSRPAPGGVGMAPPPPRADVERPGTRGEWRRCASARAGARPRTRAHAVRHADRSLPGRGPPARRRLQATRARALARALGLAGVLRSRIPTPGSLRPRRRPSRAMRRCSRASRRSRHKAARDSSGRIPSVGCMRAHLESGRGRRAPRNSTARSRSSSWKEAE